MAFLSSHRAAGHISGECISVDGGMEGRLIWKEEQILKSTTSTSDPAPPTSSSSALSATNATPVIPTVAGATSIPKSLLVTGAKRRIRISLTIDFDAISGYLGTGHT